MDDKQFQNLRAELALRGYALHRLDDQTFIVCRWEHSRHFTTIAAVEAFLASLGTRR